MLSKWNYQHDCYGSEVERGNFVVEDWILAVTSVPKCKRNRDMTLRYPIKIPFQLRPLQHDEGTLKTTPNPWWSCTGIYPSPRWRSWSAAADSSRWWGDPCPGAPPHSGKAPHHISLAPILSAHISEVSWNCGKLWRQRWRQGWRDWRRRDSNPQSVSRHGSQWVCQLLDDEKLWF